MKYIIILLFSVILFSCNKENANKISKREMFEEMKFRSRAFEQLFKTSIKDLQISMEGTDKNAILEFYVDPNKNYDTIVNIKNCPPISLKNLVHVKKYQDYHIYIYYTDNLEHTIGEFIYINEDHVKSVNLRPVPNEFECIYKKAFVLKNNQFIPTE